MVLRWGGFGIVLTHLASAHMVDATARGWGAMLMFLARAHMVDATAMLGWFLDCFVLAQCTHGQCCDNAGVGLGLDVNVSCACTPEAAAPPW